MSFWYLGASRLVLDKVVLGLGWEIALALHDRAIVERGVSVSLFTSALDLLLTTPFSLSGESGVVTLLGPWKLALRTAADRLSSKARSEFRSVRAIACYFLARSSSSSCRFLAKT
jgi:hypothetical protein